jgi:hypothetical protein
LKALYISSTFSEEMEEMEDLANVVQDETVDENIAKGILRSKSALS